jgi:hypothetical protein
MANLLNSEPSLEVDANSKSRKWEFKVQVEHGGGGGTWGNLGHLGM